MAASSKSSARPRLKSNKSRTVDPSQAPTAKFGNLQLYRAAIVIIGLTLIAYIPSFRAGYIWDDSDHVTQVPFQRTMTALKWVWFKLGATPQYYPLTHTIFWLEYRLWGSDPAGYHAVNILLHIACAVLVWRVVWQLEIRGAWLVAAIFAVHPVNVESVAWITERKNTLSAFLYLFSTLAALRAFGLARGLSPSPAEQISQRPTHPWLSYALCLLFFILAVLSKTVTCTLPAVLVLILWWKHGRVSKRDWLLLFPLFAVALGAAALTSGMEKWNVGARGPDFAFTFAQRVLIAGRAIWFYAGKLIWPHPLIFIYPRWEIDTHVVWQWLFPASAVAVVTALFLSRKRIGRGPLVAVLFFIGTLFPALGFVDVYPMRFSFVADHFQYLASIGIIILVVQVIPWHGFPTRVPGTNARVGNPCHNSLHPLSFCLCAILLATLAYRTYEQTLPYKDADALWLDTLAKNPACWLAMDDLGADAATRGDRDAALAWYNRSLAIHPNQQEAHLGKGELLAGSAPPRFKEAEENFAAAAEIRPDDARPIHEQAKLLVAENNINGALKKYEQVLAIEPKLESARLEYANLLRLQNRAGDAEAQLQKAIEINPDSFQARDALAGMYYFAGNIPGAITLMSEAIDINPTDPTMFNNLGAFLMAAGHPAEAAEQFNSAITLNPNFAEAYDGLGKALVEQGKSRDAEKMFRKALELKPDLEDARRELSVLPRQ